MQKYLTTALTVLLIAIFAGCGAESYNHLTHDEAREIMHSKPDAIVLDVRTQEEYEKKHIPGAMLVPIEELREGNFDSLPDKAATILIYCRTGRRATEAAEILTSNGYNNVYEFGGIVDWTGSVSGTEIE